MENVFFLVVLIGLPIFAIFALGVRIIRPVEVGIIEFLGRYSKTASAGFNWIAPFLSKMYRINITELRVDIDPQSIITKDKLNAIVDGVVYYRVDNAKNAIYNVNNFSSSVPSLAKTTLRAVSKWGIIVVRVELQRIEPPEDVQDAMNQVVKAENEKIAALDLATAIETKADGERRAEIKKAEGIAAAIRLRAEADGEAIKVVNVAAEEYFVGNAQLLKKLETVAEALKENTKIIVPADSTTVKKTRDSR
jgi:regulator of protease activity HflC (stomatin/prohibitin superfamily)